jgi:ferredoxin
MAVIHSLYREPGTITIDEKTCRRCGQCANICPADVLKLEDGGLRVHEDSAFGCVACGHCMMVCPEGSVRVTGRGISPEDLVPLPSPEERASADALAALMRARRSVRRFTDEDVDMELLERIVDMATSGPMGIPPWDIGCVTVRGRDEVHKLATEIIKGYEGFLKIFKPWLLAVMRPIIGRAKYEMFRHFIRPLAESYVDGWRDGRDLLFYDAPALLIFHHSPYADVADAMVACTYAMLAAESIGLGNTIIGGAPPILQRNRELSRKLGIPEANTACTCLIVGYPAAPFKRAIRRRFTHVTRVPKED